MDPSSTLSLSKLAFDTNRASRYTSTNSTCYIGINITSPSISMKLLSIQLAIRAQPSLRANFDKLQFQGSNDGGLTWENITGVSNRSRQYLYSYKRNRDFRNSSCTYKIVRVYDGSGMSKCAVDCVAFKGELVNVNSGTANSTVQSNGNIGPFNLTITDGLTTQTIPNLLTYSDTATPTITNITPKTGHYLGHYNITLTGTNLQGNVKINIDTIPCINIINNATTIICQVQQRPDGLQLQEAVFQVLVNGSYAVLREQFMYVMRWSNQSTWGVSFKPINGDLVHVPKGQVLYIDQSTPNLLGIVVQGKIIFADQRPMTITTDFITINKGTFIAGTQ